MPSGPKPGTQTDLDKGQMLSQPGGDWTPTAVNVPGHQQVSNDQFAMDSSPSQVLAYDLKVRADPGKPRGAVVVAEFKVGQPDIEHSVQPLTSASRCMRIGFEDEPGLVRQLSHELQNIGQMNCRFS